MRSRLLVEVIYTCEVCPSFKHLKDLDTGEVWAACFHPLREQKLICIIPENRDEKEPPLSIPKWCPLPKREEVR